MQKKYRLRSRSDFQKVYRIGRSSANSQFVVYAKANARVKEVRAGLSVSKKLGNAVVRNRIRRRLKEIIRHHIDEIEPHFDLVLIARKKVVEQDYAQMERSLLHVLKRARLLKSWGSDKAVSLSAKHVV